MFIKPEDYCQKKGEKLQAQALPAFKTPFCEVLKGPHTVIRL